MTGVQTCALPIYGDGLTDVIAGLSAHGFGLAWFEQYREGGEIRFREHIIMNKEPNENRYGVKFSELHANFMINTGDATAADLEGLGEQVRADVKSKFGVELHWEIKRIGRR